MIYTGLPFHSDYKPWYVAIRNKAHAVKVTFHKYESINYNPDLIGSQLSTVERTYQLPVRNDLLNLSNHFDYGYEGKACDMLALSILAHSTQSDSIALAHYKIFAEKFLYNVEYNQRLHINYEEVKTFLSKVVPPVML